MFTPSSASPSELPRAPWAGFYSTIAATTLASVGDAEDPRLVEWRSWLDKGALPRGWDPNLWDEFYSLHFRRSMWRGFRELLKASPQDAQETANFLTAWVLRNHVETQAIAIRRIANRTTDVRSVSLVRLLDEIAAEPHVIGANPADAKQDADALHEGARRVSTFANRVVAHLDRDHAAASRDVSLRDIDDVVDLIGRMWEKLVRQGHRQLCPGDGPWDVRLASHPSLEAPQPGGLQSGGHRL